jgi:hypothetical protein
MYIDVVDCSKTFELYIFAFEEFVKTEIVTALARRVYPPPSPASSLTAMSCWKSGNVGQ